MVNMLNMCKGKHRSIWLFFYHGGDDDNDNEIVIAMTMLILTLGSALLRHQR